MDKIGHFKKLIFGALEEREKAGEPFLIHGHTNTRLSIKPQDIRDIEEYFIQQLQLSFIEDSKDTGKEVERIERLFSLPFYSIEVPYKNRKGGVITGEGVNTYRYTFKELEDDLNNRTLQPPYGERDGELIVGHVLAITNYYEWLKNISHNSARNEPAEFVQLWKDPERDIPIIRDIFKALEYIDENEVWNIARFKNPWGPIHAIIHFPDKTFFSNNSKRKLLEGFGKRFSFDPNPKSRYQERYSQYEKTYNDTTLKLAKV